MTLNFDKYAQEGNLFIKELSKELGYPEDRDRTARVLRAVLHSVRDMLSPNENIQLTAQLPMFLKAVYLEKYTLREMNEKPRSVEKFLTSVKNYNCQSADHDYKTEDDVEKAVRTVLYALRKYVSMGEMEDIMAQLPKDLKQLVSRSIMWV